MKFILKNLFIKIFIILIFQDFGLMCSKKMCKMISKKIFIYLLNISTDFLLELLLSMEGSN